MRWIQVPNLTFDGVRLGVKFNHGRAQVENPALARELVAMGYQDITHEVRPDLEEIPIPVEVEEHLNAPRPLPIPRPEKRQPIKIKDL